MIIPIGDEPNPRGVPYVNYVLLACNVFVFLLISLPLMMRGPDPNDPTTQSLLQALMAQYPGTDPEVLLQELGRHVSAYDVFLLRWGYRPAHPSLITLFTSMFLHGSWVHLLGNMLFLWIYGDNVEHRLGRLGYLGAYLGTGAIAALSYGMLAAASSGDVPMVGASGAISGVLGFYFVWFPHNKVRLLVFLIPFFFVWKVAARLVLGFFVVVDNVLPLVLSRPGAGGVAYGAHLGGFVAGLLGAYVLNQWSRARCRRQAAQCREDVVSAAGTTDGAAAVERAFAAGDLAEATYTYVALQREERRDVSIPAVLGMADWLAANGQPDAAVAVYGEVLREHPRGPHVPRVLLEIGLVLLHGKQRPTAAFQYLMDALHAEPDPEVERRAREALAAIEALQKHPLRSGRWWGNT